MRSVWISELGWSMGIEQLGCHDGPENAIIIRSEALRGMAATPTEETSTGHLSQPIGGYP